MHKYLSARLTWFLDSNSTVQILLALSSYLYMYQVKTFSVFKHYKDKTESQEEEQKWIISVSQGDTGHTTTYMYM